MDICANVQKLHGFDPIAVPATEVLRVAISGVSDQSSILAPGKPADLILVDLAQPHLQPFYNADLLVYAATGSDIRTVIVEGRVLMEEGKLCTIDLAETYPFTKEQIRSRTPVL